MVYLVEKLFHNSELNIELTSYIDDKQNVWFKGKDIAKILGYSNTKDALKRHVSEENKMLHLMWPQCWGRETRPQQNASVPKTWTVGWGRETPGQQNASGAGGDVSPPQQSANSWGPKTGRQ